MMLLPELPTLQDAGGLTPDSLLRVWWAIAGMLVLLMQIGFIRLEMGSLRSQNRTGIAVKNFVLLLVSTLGFLFVGFRLMYGESIGCLIGNPFKLSPNHDLGAEWVFLQLGFASVAATIITGALGGRSTLLSNAIIALVITTVAYPLFGHWVWNDGGWLKKYLHVFDFAGSGVVHLVGGSAAFVAAYVLEPRTDAIRDDGRLMLPLGPRHLPHVTTGVVFLWIGWIGFNGGSVFSEHFVKGRGFPLIGDAIIATCIAASAGGMATLFLSAIHRRLYGPGRNMRLAEFLSENMGFDPYATLSGTMGGMVAITANCRWVGDRPWLAALIGISGGIAAFFVSLWVKKRIDDPVDAVAVHAGAGSIGLLFVAFDPGAPLLRQPNPTLWGQAVAVIAAIGVSVAIVYPVAKLLSWLELFRVSAEDEQVGLSWEPPVKAIVPYSRVPLVDASPPVPDSMDVVE